MRTIRTIAEMRAWLGNCRAESRTVGLVPTMGAFHAGHHSLMRAARDEQDAVVVSLFVNPAQFNDAKDLAAYPRSEANDAAEAAELGRRRAVRAADERDLPRGLRDDRQRRRALRGPRGRRARPRALRGRLHRRQQAAEHRRARTSRTSARRTPSRSRSSSGWCATSTCRSQIEVLPTVREPDGLALSSRNVRLSPEDRAAGALALRARCTPRATPSPPASATPSASAPPRWPSSATSTPSTSRSSTRSPSPR